MNGVRGSDSTSGNRPAPRQSAKRTPASAFRAQRRTRRGGGRAALDSRAPQELVVIGGTPQAPATPATSPGPAPRASRRAGTAPPTASPLPAQDDLFARYTSQYAAGRPGRTIAILRVGCTTALSDLGVARLRADGTDAAVTLIDDDQPVTRAAVAADDSLHHSTLGDLRTVPLPPRSFDIVQCALLLHRIRHAELVLDRVIAAIRPGGLLLLRIRDRDSAAGFLDRALPLTVRRMFTSLRGPGARGPHPAVYERLSSARGIQAYVLLRGLVIAERRALGAMAGGTRRGPRWSLVLQKLLAGMSGGRLTAAHEELLYVLRKPENRFARVL